MKLKHLTINPLYDNKPFRDFVTNIRENFEHCGIAVHQGRNVVKIFSSSECGLDFSVAIKKYKVPNPFQRVWYTMWRPSKAMKAYRNAFILNERGISTPVSIAVAEYHQSGLFHTGYYISEHVTDFAPLSDRIYIDGKINLDTVSQLAELMTMIHTKGIVFKDLNPTNILCTQDGGLTLIDINRMTINDDGSPIPPQMCKDDFMSFTDNYEFYYLVMQDYCRRRNINLRSESLDKIMFTKALHNINYRNKKSFLRKLKRMFLTAPKCF